jgi:hypothetical protein
MNLHSVKEEEEDKDIFHQLRNFSLWINQSNILNLISILLKKKTQFHNLRIKAK